MTASLVIVASLFGLAGCSSGPSRDEVVERSLIEILAANGIDSDDETAREIWREPAGTMADHALEGMCGEPGYWAGLEEAESARAFAAVCLMYFEDDMSEAQREHALLLVVDAALED